MARFDELNKNLMDVLDTLITSQNLCKLLSFPIDNPLAQSDIADTSTLLFTKIFPIPKLPETSDNVQTAKGSLLTVVFDEIRKTSGNLAFKDSILCFNVYCHIDLWQMKNTGQLRPYAIMHEIDMLFNQQRIVGIGKTQFIKSRIVASDVSNLGYKLEYNVTDFN